VFAILLYINQVESIDKFYREGFDDKMLPVWKYGESFTMVYPPAEGSAAVKAANVIAATLHQWIPQTLFCNHAQWLFLAPTFRKGEFQYEFHPKALMPFLNKGESQSSGFSDVTKWSIHRDHLETDLVSFELLRSSAKRNRD
jgi:hypothetical protein